MAHTSDDLDRTTDQVLDLVGGRAAAQVRTTVVRHGLTRFANSHVHQHVGERTATVDLKVTVDGRTASASTSRLGGDGLSDLVDTALALAAVSPVDEDDPGLAEPHEIPDLDHLAPDTVDASPDARADVVAAFIAQADDSDAAGYCETQALWTVLGTTTGHRARGATSRATIDGIHRRGQAAGTGHQTSRSLGELDGAAVGARAARLMGFAADPVDLEPGRLPVVLSPECVATLSVFLGLYGFNAKAVAEQRSFVKVGEAQFDPRYRLVDDPTDPRSCGFAFDAEGTAKRRLELVRDGVSQSLAHDRRTAAAAGTTSTGHHVPGSETMGPIPTDLVVAGGDIGHDELVAGLDRGLLVTAFNYCRVLDPRTVVVTGLTRNGTFLVEDGQVQHAVGNLRFTQSFVDAVGPGAIDAVGDDDRYADSEFGAGLVIAPSLRLSSWNFTGGAKG